MDRVTKDMTILERIIRLLRLKPNPKRIAQQLRKPHGAIARKVADKMNESNAPLYDLAFREMKPGGRFFVIIRSKETLEMMPFSRFGFNVYEAGACEALLQENGFLDVKTVEYVEAPVEYDGGSYQLKSLFISALKAE